MSTTAAHRAAPDPRQRRRLTALTAIVLTTLVGLVAAILGITPSATAATSPTITWVWGNNDGNSDSATPTQVPSLTGTIKVAGGGTHSLALQSNGTVMAWGTNVHGQLGDGTTTNSSTPTTVTGLTNVTAIAAGYEYSLALKSDGTVWAWGSNIHGELGNGTFNYNANPRPIQVQDLTNVTEIAADNDYSGGSNLAVRGDGTVWAWGFDAYSTSTNNVTPIQIPGLADISAVSICKHHSMALSRNGTVWGWGTNDLNQVGGPTTDPILSPMQIPGIAHVTAISAGGGSSLALRNDGTVWGWGFTYTRFTDGNLVAGTTPVQVEGLRGISAISASGLHNLALDGSGNVWAWGDNFYGQLGNGYPRYQSDPNPPFTNPVLNVKGATAIATGYMHGLAVSGSTETSPSPSISASSSSSSPSASTSPSGSSTSQSTKPAKGEHAIPGDSYTAGEGADSYYPDSNSPKNLNTCHRSRNAYGPLLNKDAKTGKLNFVACSGAVTDDFYVANPLNPGEGPQLDRINPSTTLITLTIGGNDSGFAHVITKCTEGQRKPGETEDKLGKYGCSENEALRRDISNRLSALAGQPADEIIVGRPIHTLADVYRDLHKRAPNAKIQVAGYPHIFGSDTKSYQNEILAPSGKVCEVGSTRIAKGIIPLRYKVDYRDAVWLNGLADRLNTTIQAAVAQARQSGVPIQYISPSRFDKHGLCDTSASWFHGLEFVGKTTETSAASFHPTSTGQQNGYEKAFLAKN